MKSDTALSVFQNLVMSVTNGDDTNGDDINNNIITNTLEDLGVLFKKEK
jgi:hypothetical protein